MAEKGWAIRRWLDHVETDADAELVADDGAVAVLAGRARALCYKLA